MNILTVKFRAKSNVECLLALHSATFVLLTTKNYIFGFREIFGGECFVMELFSFLHQRNPIETQRLFSDIGISENDYVETLADFNRLCESGEKVDCFNLAICNNRMTEKQLSLF